MDYYYHTSDAPLSAHINSKYIPSHISIINIQYIIMVKLKKISAKRPHLRVQQSTAISLLFRRVKQIIERNRKFLDNVDVSAVPGIDNLSAHLAS